MKSMRWLALGAVLTGVIAARGARAETVEDFYKKTPLSIYVGSGAGGGFDEIARVVAQHIGHHIPGSPTVVVKNMPGAGGLVNVNFMANTAPRDGSAIAAPFNTVFMLPLFGDPAAKFDPRTFTWLGSLDKQTATCVVWHTSSIKSLDDAKTRQVLVGATGTNATPAIFPNVLDTLLGTKFKVISGYSTNEVRLAMERGETEGVCGLAWQTWEAVAPNWIAEKKLRFLGQMGLVKNPAIPDVPLVMDLIKDPKQRQTFELVVLPQEFGRPYVAPPGIPADRAKALVDGFEAMMKDPAFVADAARIRLKLDPLSGKDIMDLLNRAYHAPKDVIERAAKFSVVK